MKNQTRKAERIKPRQSETFTVFRSICEKWGDCLHRVAFNSFLGRYFTSYSSFENRIKKSGLAVSLKMRRDELHRQKYHPKLEIGTEEIDDSLSIYNASTIHQSGGKKIRRVLAGNPLLYRLVTALCNFPKAPASALGMFLFSFGLSSVSVRILHMFRYDATSDVIYSAICGLLLALLSVPVMTKGNVTIYGYLLQSGWGHDILAFALGADRDIVSIEEKEQATPVHGRWGTISFILAVLLSLVTAHMTFWMALGTLVLIIFGFWAMCKPEFGLLLVTFFAPFIEIIPFGWKFLLLYTLVSFLGYLVKVFVGKRSIRLEIFDFFALFFLLFMAFSELFRQNFSTEHIFWVYICGTLFYLMTKNMLRNGGWIPGFVNALVASSLAVSVIGIVQFLLDRSLNVCSVFQKSEHLAIYLVLSFFFTLCAFRSRYIGKSILIFTWICQIGCLCLTGSLWAQIALAIGIFFYLALFGKELLAALFLSIPFFALVGFLLPTNISTAIFSALVGKNTINQDLVTVWKNSVTILKDHFWGGIGFSNDSFARVYSLVGVENSTSDQAGSLYLQLAVSEGFVAGLLFLLFAILFIRMFFSTFVNKRFVRYPESNLLVCGFCAIFSLLLLGFVDYVWDSDVVFVLFWGIVGSVCASRQYMLQKEEIPSMSNEQTGEIVISIRNKR